MNKEMRSLVRSFKAGYHLQGGSRGKFRLIGPDGEVVRENGRPVLIAATPTFHHDYKRRMQRQFERLGVIDSKGGRR